MRQSPSWLKVQSLISVQQYQGAYDLLETIRQETLNSPHREQEYVEALIEQVQLRIALHGEQTAVEHLLNTPWPNTFLARATLDLFVGHTILQYTARYSWEIRQRTKIESSTKQDITVLTADQLVALATERYQRIWATRSELDSFSATVLSNYLNAGNYPNNIRGTLRDVISYLTVALLADTTHWRPEQSNDLYRLGLKKLLGRSPEVSGLIRVDDDNIHPLTRLCGVLDDLERWHSSNGRADAALEARLERLRRLYQSFTDTLDREVLIDDLRRTLARHGNEGWWSVGQALLAQWVNEAGDKVEAHKLAQEGVKPTRYGYLGEAQCRALLAQIEHPAYSIRCLQFDGVGTRNLAVQYKNIRKVYFKAFAVDAETFVLQGKDYNLLPAYNEWKALWSGSRGVLSWFRGTGVAAEWTVDLPETIDYQLHTVHCTLPLQKSGMYVILASLRSDFADSEGNLVVAGSVVLSEMMILTGTSTQEGKLEAIVVSGRNGAPVAGAEVSLGECNWNTAHQIKARAKTNQHGEVVFDLASINSYYMFLFAKKDAEITVLPNVGRPYGTSEHDPIEVLIYTDRAIYRPEQTLHFKVLSYFGSTKTGNYQLMPGQNYEVQLRDSNAQTVASTRITTNDFGSASGSFVIPTGRMLGSWTVHVTSGHSATVKVEEYKRPTFEVSIQKPETALRLNETAKIKAEAKYYFGMPVTAGKVKWKVERAPRLPAWWYWSNIDLRPQRIASGESELTDKGIVEIEFLAEADPRKSKLRSVSYMYTLRVEITDEGGETRTATRSFRLGYSSIEASIQFNNRFALHNQPLSLTVARTDLDGTPRAGNGKWKLVAVQQPTTPVLGPADMAMPPSPEDEGKFSLPGDSIKGRWETQYDPVRTAASWQDGVVYGQGQMVHEADGIAHLTLPPLASGVYRVRYEGRDDRGNSFESENTFICVATSTPIAVPAIFEVESPQVEVGGVARLFVASGTTDQILYLDIFQRGQRVERRHLKPGDPELIEFQIAENNRGGFGITMFTVRDFQLISISRSIFVPWTNKELQIELHTFRDKLQPGSHETWRLLLKGPDGSPLKERVAEILAYMYDRSLDALSPHSPVHPLTRYPSHTGTRSPSPQGYGILLSGFLTNNIPPPPASPVYSAAAFVVYSNYGIGGPGARGYYMGGRAITGMGIPVPAFSAPMGMPAPAPGGAPMPPPAAAPAAAPVAQAAPAAPAAPPPPQAGDALVPDTAAAPEEPAEVQMRSNFAETAFFFPHLYTGKDGTVSIDFDLPDSVTEWAFWTLAVTKDLVSALQRREVKTVKELMVRPYLPRFLREGDEADLRIMVNNASDRDLKGNVTLQITDPETQEDLTAAFGVEQTRVEFHVLAGQSTTLSFALNVPNRVGPVSFRVEARAPGLSDGELREIPVLPSRMHLAQSKFVTLRNKDRREITFADMLREDDASMIHDSLVVTLDAQLFYTVLKALPYLVEYPYECCEQTLNRFVSSGIVTSVYKSFPSIAAMAKNLSVRTTQLEAWDKEDPNRRMALEESPWLREARGGEDPKFPLLNLLDPQIATQQREISLKKLTKSQTASGGFPWFAGGPPSSYITLYLLEGFAKALEFGVTLPVEMVQKAWRYMSNHFREDIFPKLRRGELSGDTVTFLLYTLYSYREESYTAGAFSKSEREELIEYAWANWRSNAPMLKLYLTLTLHRLGRKEDARLILASVMDSAKTEPDRGTFWAQEAQSWLWYNDTTETHAFALRTLTEVTPEDTRRDGLVLWLLLDKKLNHWKSTKATAQAIYALVHHMASDGSLGVKESVKVQLGTRAAVEYVFEPDKYVGKVQHVTKGADIRPKECLPIVIEKETPGFMFASATWHFSTEKLPDEARGDFFEVKRTFYKREMVGAEATLHPLNESGVELQVGDEVEVHLVIKAGHRSEYVHLRDPRPAGFEPASLTSGYKWDLGLVFYEEIRDSATNFFFEHLPVGQYTLKHRLRASMAGIFRAHPATLQAMYAPEFVAYSAGEKMDIRPA